MAPLATYLACFSLALSATALTTPHISNTLNHHRAVARAVTAPEVLPVIPEIPKRQRYLNKRCVPRPSGNSTTSSSSPAYTSTPLINSIPSPSANSTASASYSSPTLSLASVSPSLVPWSSVSSSTSTSSTYTSAPTQQASSSTPTPTSSAPPAQISSDVVGITIPSQYAGIQQGQGTFYSTGLGACGITNNDSQYIVAISHLLFDSFGGADPNNNPICNQQVTASYGGKSVTVTITDRCEGCAITDLDFSPKAFSQLADQSLGRINIQWQFS